ncbi:MAG: T9SS type A sorting domain-containing protein [Bacteroidota bacterium]|nr:T9SS type A sorting domain-containing protein [Bacteroidota bacterium]
MKRSLLTLFVSIMVLGLSAQTEVYTPSLLSPSNGDSLKMPNVTLSWNAISGSTNLKYEIQVDTSANFNSPLKKDTTQTLLTGYSTFELRFNQTYYWRVRAIDLGETSYWSEVWKFKTFNTLELDKPTAGATNQVPNVAISWKNTIKSNAITGIKYYDYQVDTTSTFNSTALIEGTTNAPVITSTLSNLRFGQKYYWRVRARHLNGSSSYCAARNFTVLDKVTLTSPTNNATKQNLDVLLKWSKVTGILAYQYQISLDQNFTQIVTGSEQDTVNVNGSLLQFGKDYYWRVRVRHLTDTSLWCDPFKFTTINTVDLISPSNGAQNVDLKPILQWTKITGIVGYQLQLDSLNSFAAPIFSYKMEASNTTYAVGIKLKTNHVYFWRMRAYSDGGLTADTTAWSPVFSFTTTKPTGINEENASNFSIYPNPAHDRIQLKLNANGNTLAQFILMDIVGKKVMDEEIQVNPGMNTQDISLSNVKSGIYIVRIILGDNIYNQKIIIK